MIKVLKDSSCNSVKDVMHQLDEYILFDNKDYVTDMLTAQPKSASSDMATARNMLSQHAVLNIDIINPSLGSYAQLKSFLKRIIKKGIRWYLGTIAEQQVRFNQAVVRYLDNIKERDEEKGFPANWRANLIMSADIGDMTCYVEYFKDKYNVVDLNASTGEFLTVLKNAGVKALGIDTNPYLAEACLEKGLDVSCCDPLSFLELQKDNSLGGLFAAGLMETLSDVDLVRLLSYAAWKLQPGCCMIIEAGNPMASCTLPMRYNLDPAIRRRLSPPLLQNLSLQAGFATEKLAFSIEQPTYYLVCRKQGRN